MKKYFFCLLLLLNLFNSFSKENLFLFKNEEYFALYPEKKEIYNKVKNKFNNYKIFEIKIKNFASIKDEFSSYSQSVPGGVIFVDDFIAPYFLRNSNFSPDKKFKLISYGMFNNIGEFSPFPVFYISPDYSYLYIEIENSIHKFSKKKDFSDCGLIINSNYDFSFNSIEFLEKKQKKVIPFNSTGNVNVLKDWVLNSKNLKTIVLFTVDTNHFITQVEDKNLQKIKLIEVLSNFGTEKKSIKRRISIDMVSLVNSGINSKEFKNFIKQKNVENKITVYKPKKKFFYSKNY
jgi:hypothetical protein